MQAKDKEWGDPIAGRQSRGLTDDDPMPFGTHKGKCMKYIPAQYLDWLIDQEWIGDWPAVEAYIEDHKEVIDAELEEGSTDLYTIDPDEIPW